MIKLLILFLFIFKTKCENESSFKIKLKSKRRLFNSRTDKPHNAVNYGEELVVKKSAAQSTFRSFSGRKSCFKPKEVLAANENIELDTFHEYLDMRHTKGVTKDLKKSNSKSNKIINRNSKYKDYESSTPFFHLATKTLRPKKNFKRDLNNSKRINEFDSLVQHSGTKSKFADVNVSRTVGVEIYPEERNGELNDYHENYISKYISEKNLDMRKTCLKCPEKTRKTRVTPEFEQADRGVELLVTLLDMNCVRARHRFDPRTTLKKVMTRHPSHCRKHTTKKMMTHRKDCIEICRICGGSTITSVNGETFQHSLLLKKGSQGDSCTTVGTKQGGIFRNTPLLHEAEHSNTTLKQTTSGYC